MLFASCSCVDGGGLNPLTTAYDLKNFRGHEHDPNDRLGSAVGVVRERKFGGWIMGQPPISFLKARDWCIPTEPASIKRLLHWEALLSSSG